MALSKEDEGQVLGLIKTALDPVTASVTTLSETVGKLPTTESVTNAVTEAVKPLTESLAKLGTKPADGKGKPGEAPEPNAELTAMKEQLAKVTEALGGITSERTAAQETAATKALVEKSLTDLKLGGLLKKQRIVAAIVAGKPKTADDVKKLVDEQKAYAEELGIDVKAFGADAAAEGGKPGGDGSGATQDSEAIAKQILERKSSGL